MAGDGRALTANDELQGQSFIALDGGPHFKFTEAVSFLVVRMDQAEVDARWDKLLDGGALSQYGWLKDRYGLYWQIVPAELFDLMSDPEPRRTKRV